jgi:hypothetical protein
MPFDPSGVRTHKIRFFLFVMLPMCVHINKIVNSIAALSEWDECLRSRSHCYDLCRTQHAPHSRR